MAAVTWAGSRCAFQNTPGDKNGFIKIVDRNQRLIRPAEKCRFRFVIFRNGRQDETSNP